MMSVKPMTNDAIINRLIIDLEELIPQQKDYDFSVDGYGDYVMGVIERSQTVLRMMGVPESEIPNDGSC